MFDKLQKVETVYPNENPVEVVNSFIESGEFKIFTRENSIIINFIGNDIKNNNERIQFELLTNDITETDPYGGKKDFKYFVDLSWLHNKVLNEQGNIGDKDFYIQVTDDDSLNGCLYMLDGEKQVNLTYLELLACTGLKQTIVDKISELEMRCPEIRNRYLHCIRLKNGGMIMLNTRNVEYYASMILRSRLTQDQFKYYFNCLDGFEYDSSGKLSRHPACRYFLNRWRAKSVGRVKLGKGEVPSDFNGKSIGNSRFEENKKYMNKASSELRGKFSH